MFLSLIRRSLQNLLLTPWTLALTLGAITLVTFLAGIMLLILSNIQKQVDKKQNLIQFQLYWHPGTEREQYRQQWQQLGEIKELASLQTFTPEQALEKLLDSVAGFEDSSLTAGILPPTAIIELYPPQDNLEQWAKRHLQYLQKISGVKKVNYNPLQLDIALSWNKLTHKIFWPLILFLMIIMSLIVANTMKLSLLQRRDEITILRLVGASRAYIRLPLIIGGAIQGIFGGILAVFMLKLLQIALFNLLNFPPLWIKIEYLSFEYIFFMLFVPMLIAMISSFIAFKE